jgi:hypothetical protein
VDVTGADFSDVNMTGARAAVNWADAKVQPAVLPESFPMPPPWLPLVIVGSIVTLVAILILRRSRNKQ